MSDEQMDAGFRTRDDWLREASEELADKLSDVTDEIEDKYGVKVEPDDSGGYRVIDE